MSIIIIIVDTTFIRRNKELLRLKRKKIMDRTSEGALSFLKVIIIIDPGDCRVISIQAMDDPTQFTKIYGEDNIRNKRLDVSNIGRQITMITLLKFISFGHHRKLSTPTINSSTD
jgi:hypothetical protein